MGLTLLVSIIRLNDSNQTLCAQRGLMARLRIVCRRVWPVDYPCAHRRGGADQIRTEATFSADAPNPKKKTMSRRCQVAAFASWLEAGWVDSSGGRNGQVVLPLSLVVLLAAYNAITNGQVQIAAYLTVSTCRESHQRVLFILRVALVSKLSEAQDEHRAGGSCLR
jgi:hypothetical protein